MNKRGFYLILAVVIFALLPAVHSEDASQLAGYPWAKELKACFDEVNGEVDCDILLTDCQTAAQDKYLDLLSTSTKCSNGCSVPGTTYGEAKPCIDQCWAEFQTWLGYSFPGGSEYLSLFASQTASFSNTLRLQCKTVAPKSEEGFEAEEDLELSDNPGYKDLENFFARGGTLSADEVKKLKEGLTAQEASVSGSKGEKLSINLKEGSPIEKINTNFDQSIDNAVTTVTFIDDKTLSTAIRDLSKPSTVIDFPPITDPPSDKYSVLSNFRIDTVSKTGARVNPYGEGFFDINVPKSDAESGTVKLLRYDSGQKRDWDVFDARNMGCYAETCRYSVDPPVEGYFAIVIEKSVPGASLSTAAQGFLFCSLTIIVLVALVFLELKYGKEKFYGKFKLAKSFGEKMMVLREIPLGRFVFRLGALYLGLFFFLFFFIGGLLINPGGNSYTLSALALTGFISAFMGILFTLLARSIVFVLSKIA